MPEAQPEPTPGQDCAKVTFEQHETALTWRALCSCGGWVGHWRASPDRSLDDHQAHRRGVNNGGWLRYGAPR